MKLYCTHCHLPLPEGSEGHMVARKRVCDSCYEKLTQSPEVLKKLAIQADADKERLFSFLMSIFPIGDIPESWYVSVDSMIKKNISPKDIFNTLFYIRTKVDKELTEENWSALVYIYYKEAMSYVEELRAINARNQRMELHQSTQYYAPKDTTQRDTPNYKMEDII